MMPASLVLPAAVRRAKERLSAVLSTGGPAKAEGPANEHEQVASTPLSPETVRDAEERARELRLYAARLDLLHGRNLGR